MKLYFNFKSGIFTGCIIGIAFVIFGYYSFQKMTSKADNIATMDLNILAYQDLEGNEVLLSNFEGKNVFINFWATWCAPCIEEFSVLNEAYALMKDDFVFIVVSYEATEKIKQFASSKPYDFVYLKSNNFILEGITTVPQTFILNRNGDNIYHHPTNFEGNAEDIVKILGTWIE